MADELATWNPADPRSADPVPGQPGHFDHHKWVKEFVLAANLEIAALKARVEELETP